MKNLKDTNLDAYKKKKEILENQVIEMLKYDNPVEGVYAMYGAHHVHPLFLRNKYNENRNLDNAFKK